MCGFVSHTEGEGVREDGAEKDIGREMDEITGEWIVLNNEEPNGLYALPDIIRLIKSRIMRWEGQVARMGDRRGAYRFFVCSPKRKKTNWKNWA